MRFHSLTLGAALTASVMLFGSATYETHAGNRHILIGCNTGSVEPVPVRPDDAEVSGSALLCVTPHRLMANMTVRDLVPGNAYTVWWVYINDPLNDCLQDGVPGCDGFDGLEAFMPFESDPQSPAAVFGRMDSVVARRHGRAHLNDMIDGFQPRTGSQIQLLIFGHGAANYADPRRLARQLLTPEDACAGNPHLGIGPCIEGFPVGYPAAVAVFEIE